MKCELCEKEEEKMYGFIVVLEDMNFPFQVNCCKECKREYENDEKKMLELKKELDGRQGHFENI